MKLRMTLFYLTIIVAIALGGLTIYQAWDKVKSDKTADRERAAADLARDESREAQKRANDYFEKLTLAQAKIEELNKISLVKADDIIAKNDELIRAQSETLKQVLGDGIVRIIFMTNGNGEIRFGLQNTGNYTARDVKINAIEFTKELRDKFKNGCFNRSDLAKNDIPIPDFQYLKSKQIEVFKISGNDANQRAYQFSIYCQHATFIEYLVVDKDENDLKWYGYFKLYQVINDNLVLLDESKCNPGSEEQYCADLFEKYFVMHPFDIVQDL